MKYESNYPIVGVTADAVIFYAKPKSLEKIRILMIKRNTEPFKGQWALPGGFIDSFTDQNLAHTAQRELKEETGIDIDVEKFQLVGTYSDLGRDPRGRVVSTAYSVVVHSMDIGTFDKEEVSDIKWVSFGGGMELKKAAFDHRKIAHEAYMKRFTR